MSGQAETFPVTTGHPESWNLRTDSVNNSSVCEISENENWMNRSDGNRGADDGGNFSRGVMSKTSSLESKPTGTCLQASQCEQTPSSAEAGMGDANAKRKRHSSTSNPGNHRQVTRKRRKTIDRSTTHPKFLMGGSNKDPLNLNSLCNEEVSRFLNAATPISSPLPLVNKDPNPIIVPVDVRDPLKLNTVCSETDATTNLTRTLMPKTAGKKRKKRPDKLGESHSADEAAVVSKPANLNLDGIASKLAHHANASKVSDKIVSPVLPESGQAYRKRKKQEPTAKIARALLVEEPADPKPAEDSPDKKPHPHARERTTPEKRKYKRQTSKESKTQPPKFKDQNKKFQYGNYHRYYGYRNPDQEDDSRIPFLKRKWFEGKLCLDIGCNSGHVTLYIAKTFTPERITGIDIDGTLIGIARKNIRHCLAEERSTQAHKFPTSMEKIYGPITSSVQPTPLPNNTSKFPGNILFRCANFVPENDALLELQKPEFDTVLCLSVTKWIHLNWGDAGLKRMFRRIYLSLRPGGRLILEPQAWPSYTRKKKLTETIYKNFKQIQLKPDKFKDYLLSSRVGFSSCETIGTPLNKSKGFRRPILMFTKLTTSRASASKARTSVLTADQTLSAGYRPGKAGPAEHQTTAGAPRHRDGIPGKPAEATTCPGRDADTRPAERAPTSEPEPPSVPAAGRRGEGSREGAETEAPRPEDPEETSRKTKTEERETHIDAKDSGNAQEACDGHRVEDLESPPAKKLKTEPK